MKKGSVKKESRPENRTPRHKQRNVNIQAANSDNDNFHDSGTESLVGKTNKLKIIIQ